MVGNLKFSIVLLIGVFIYSSSYASGVLVKPQKGDGIHTLLKRYDLHSNPCDRDSFLELNQLNERDYLQLHRSYSLPLKVLTFNGKSIRTTMQMSDYDRALRIQNYNDTMFSRGLKDDFRKDNILWVPFREYYCDYSKAPEASVFKPYTKKYSIFGPDYEDVEIISEKLKGCVYYLVSGHGGPDPGAMSSKGEHSLCEDEYAYDVCIRAARNLLANGAKVYMIIRDPDDGIRDEVYLDPDQDERCWPDQDVPLNQIARLRQRTDIINKLYLENKETAKLQRVVVIHVDSRTAGKKIDVFFYHYPGSKVGEDLANSVLNTFRSKYGEHQKNREYTGVVKSRDLWMLRESRPTTIYLELGNITNSFDQRRLLVVNNRQAIANWLTEGLMVEVEAGKD